MPSLAGSFLVGKPTLRDPNFTQSVVLMLQHGSQGAFGVVVNKPAAPNPDLPFPVYLGGPCQSEGLLMVHGHPEWTEAPHEVAPGIYLGDPSCTDQITAAENHDDMRFRMFAGYSGWGPDQLESELASGAWAVIPADGDSLFDAPIDEIWRQLLPPMIPQPSLN